MGSCCASGCPKNNEPCLNSKFARQYSTTMNPSLSVQLAKKSVGTHPTQMLPFHSLVSHFSEARLCDVDAGAAYSNEQRVVGDGAGTDWWLATFPSFHLSAVFHLFLEVASRGSPMRIGRNRDETLAFVVEITFVSACLVREDVLMGDFWPQVVFGVIHIGFAGVPNRRPFWKQPTMPARAIIFVIQTYM